MRAEWKVVWLGPEPVPIWDIGAAGRGTVFYTNILAHFLRTCGIQQHGLILLAHYQPALTMKAPLSWKHSLNARSAHMDSFAFIFFPASLL